MSDSKKKKHDVLYQYFWIKVASKAEVNRQRAEGLTKGAVDYIQPLTQTVVIPWLRMLSTLEDARLAIDVVARNDMKEVKDKGMYVGVHMLDGVDKTKAEAWIDTDEGKAWKGEAFCFLCHASVEFQ